jgi:hypothetical protein
MTGEGRVRADQYARRVNAAVQLLAAGLDPSQTRRRLVQRYGVSERQAHRYVERARSVGRMEVPEASEVFTVKLPVSLVRRVRRHAVASARTLSSLVAQAIEELLARVRPGPAGGG